MEVRNPFVARRTAERYHLGRPYHHERTLRRLLETVPTTRGVAIDVAGGTGLSTRALSALGFRAVGIDPVEAMLALAPRSGGTSYATGVAQALPVANHVAALVTVSSAVHWFDQPRFFDEVRRVLTAEGTVIIYEHAGVHLPDDPAVMEWASTDYLARYPTMPRCRLAGSTAAAHGLQRCFDDTWVDAVSLTHPALVAYLMTQSNVVDAIESGRETEDVVRSWIAESTACFFDSHRKREFGFFVLAEALRVI